MSKIMRDLMTENIRLVNRWKLVILGLLLCHHTFATSQVLNDLECDGSEVRIDHIMWGVPNLKEGTESFARRTGIEPILGGVLGNGTLVNYLVSFGSCQYLEIIGPHPESKTHTGFAKVLSELDSGKVLGFAMAYDDLESVAVKANALGRETIGPTNGSREMSDGKLVKWRNLTLKDHGMGTLRFFYVDWLETAHPSKTTPEGIQFKGLSVSHPEHEDLAKLFNGLGLPITTVWSNAQKVSVDLDTPNGAIVLTSDGME
jgi:hypothetical protein